MADIDEAVAEWHDDPTIVIPLHEYLGMTWDQYTRWAETGALPQGTPTRLDRPVTTTDEQLAKWGREAILDAIGDLAHDRMGLAEHLADLDAFDGLDDEAEAVLVDRFEEQIRRQRQFVAGWLDEVIREPRCQVALDDGSRCIEVATGKGPGGLVMHEHRFRNG
ncbi:MAG TPA: hypothetical protein DGT23_32385 [Micromonosporaceae bacterium]|nr:hypothetical protein [Micromonosporaceae bacterium]